jgi:hypothetical protein
VGQRDAAGNAGDLHGGPDGGPDGAAGASTGPEHLERVITDGSLRRLAENRSDTTARVLIEIATPTEETTVHLGRRGRFASPPEITVNAPAAPPAPAGPPDATAAVQGILGRKPRYLRAAHAFAAVATGAQLAALAASPFVTAIRPDRQLQLQSGL